MAEFFPPVVMEIKAKATEAIAEFGKVNAELGKMEKKLTGTELAMARFQRAGRLAGTTLLGMAGAFGAVAVTSLNALDNFEKSQTRLETAVKNTGVSFKDAEPIFKTHADSMVKLGFTYSDTYDALAKMTAASGSPKVALDSLSVAADLARAKNISLAEAGTLVARASVGQARGLADLGIMLGKTIPKGATMAEVLKAIEDRARGGAKAFGDTLAGKIQASKAAFNALEISIGTNLAPAMTRIVDYIGQHLIPRLKDLGDWFSKHIGIVQAFGIALASIWGVSKILGFIKTIGELIKVMRSLAVAAGLAGIAEAFATGGLSAVSAAASLATFAATAAALGIGTYNLFKGDKKPATTTPYNPMSGQAPALPNLTGKGVTRIPSAGKTSKASIKAAEKGVTTTVVIKPQYNPNPVTHTSITQGTR